MNMHCVKVTGVTSNKVEVFYSLDDCYSYIQYLINKYMWNGFGIKWAIKNRILLENNMGQKIKIYSF